MARARENFVRLAEARTKRLLKDLDLLGNLSNKSNYSYSEEDVKAIFRAVSKKVQETELRFKMNIQSDHESDFRLPQ
ncbi:hypothetical protein SAMN06295955_101244 [Sphingopyxis indica]|uniref:Uncharacterized protein n=1 Tax=Sphingopyxis indica TaxID=436663 RepID=A0A239DGL5_9SPHN|nr:hypothetical protein SAMN06295955_101244 [Sphingopyxis indica]|tara:strand:- start:1340 stop:1570 length:231 start_codon:yes stop_codon:yes gene_type:complete